MKAESVRTVFSGNWLDVNVERWDGREREIVVRPDVVGIVAVDQQGLLTLVRQLRPPAGRELLELPGGPDRSRRGSSRRCEAGARRGDGAPWRYLDCRPDLLDHAGFLSRARPSLRRGGSCRGPAATRGGRGHRARALAKGRDRGPSERDRGCEDDDRAAPVSRAGDRARLSVWSSFDASMCPRPTLAMRAGLRGALNG